MSATVAFQRYGKCKVKVVRVTRHTSLKHDVKELSVNVLLEGNNFDGSFYTGDNSMVVPTDTMKNTVYVLAKELSVDPIEDFAVNLSKHFLKQYAHVTHTNIVVHETEWTRVSVQGKPHVHTFHKSEPYHRFCKLYAGRDGSMKLKSGISDLVLMKTTLSGFENYVRDRYTTLPESKDRIMRSSVYAEWTYSPSWFESKYIKSPQEERSNFNSMFDKIKTLMIEEFAGPADTGIYSPAVQITLYNMGKAVLNKLAEIETVYIALPNLHCNLFDLSKFNLQNNNEVFYPTPEPHGEIEALITRTSYKPVHKGGGFCDAIPDTLTSKY